MTAVELVLPVEVAGEDVANPPHQPVPAAAVIAARWPESSAEFGGPLKHDGWPDALPEWEDLTRDELDEHRSWCRDLCAFCEGHRQFGYCPGCTNPDAEAIDGLTVCCGQDVMTGDDVDRAWFA